MMAAEGSIVRKLWHVMVLGALLIPAASCEDAGPPEGLGEWPRHVLLTNDNGIDDVAIVELARALSLHTQVTVVASTEDRSGTSNLMSAVRSGRFTVERRDLGEGIRAFALDGYPADCVLFAVTGPMRDSPPDLVLSGINGGDNAADAWFGSGTIGAARTAAYMGIPAVAISGVEDDDPAAVQAAVEWVVELARSDVVRHLEPRQYLTVSLPIAPPGEILGVEIVQRAWGLMDATTQHAEEGDASGKETWELQLSLDADRAPAGSDVAALARGRIAVVPMRVDEHDPELFAALRPEAFPPWNPTASAADDEPPCLPGFGAFIDDAEDASGEEWGVLLEEVLPDGRAAEMGLLAGDVIVTLDGQDLSTPRGGREDPDDVFIRLLKALDCGQVVTLEYVRDGNRSQAGFTVPDAQ